MRNKPKYEIGNRVQLFKDGTNPRNDSKNTSHRGEDSEGYVVYFRKRNKAGEFTYDIRGYGEFQKEFGVREDELFLLNLASLKVHRTIKFKKDQWVKFTKTSQWKNAGRDQLSQGTLKIKQLRTDFVFDPVNDEVVSVAKYTLHNPNKPDILPFQVMEDECEAFNAIDFILED